MPFPEDNPFSAKDQFYLATRTGDYLKYLKDNSRKRKSGPDDNRLTEHQTKLRFNIIFDFLWELRPALGYLALEWAQDDGLREQIEAGKDPVKFFNADLRYGIEVYADLLTLSARALQRHTRGRYEGVNLSATPTSKTANDVVLQYKISRVIPPEDAL